MRSKQHQQQQRRRQQQGHMRKRSPSVMRCATLLSRWLISPAGALGVDQVHAAQQRKT
jgi:hypothetical protein